MRTRCAVPVVKVLAVLGAASVLGAAAPARAEPPPRPAAPVRAEPPARPAAPIPHISYTTTSPPAGETGAPPAPSAPQLWPAPAPASPSAPFEPEWPLVTGYALSVLAALGWLFYGHRRRA